MHTDTQSPSSAAPAASAASATPASGDVTDMPVVYIKPSCPWCQEVVEFLDERGIPYRRVDITQDAEARAEMERVSRQPKVPTLDWHGEILADFGVDELVPFLRAKNVKLEDS
jgi:glutaredoxin 3